MHFCALNEKINDSKCKLTGKKCGENMEFVPIHRRIKKVVSLSINPFHETCVQQCKCAGNFYVENDGKCFKKSKPVLPVSCFTILD